MTRRGRQRSIPAVCVCRRHGYDTELIACKGLTHPFMICPPPYKTSSWAVGWAVQTCQRASDMLLRQSDRVAPLPPALQLVSPPDVEHATSTAQHDPPPLLAPARPMSRVPQYSERIVVDASMQERRAYLVLDMPDGHWCCCCSWLERWGSLRRWGDTCALCLLQEPQRTPASGERIDFLNYLICLVLFVLISMLIGISATCGCILHP